MTLAYRVINISYNEKIISKEDFTMKSFFKDYWELCKESNKWMKKHWKGYLVLCFIVSLIYLAPYIVELSKEKRLENDFSEKEDETCQL